MGGILDKLRDVLSDYTDDEIIGDDDLCLLHEAVEEIERLRNGWQRGAVGPGHEGCAGGGGSQWVGAVDE